MTNKAILIAGLFFGDEAKGATVDSLARTTGAKLVVRYNGGPQAAHHVVLPDGRSHCFSQFGSGTFAGAKTHLAHMMAIEPLSLMNEAAGLMSFGFDPWSLLTVDPMCPVVTPFHRALNRLRERARGPARHGSCGMGVGETWADVQWQRSTLHAADLANGPVMIRRLKAIQEEKRSIATALFEEPDLHLPEWKLLNDPEAAEDYAAKLVPLRYAVLAKLPEGTTIFEGAQGALLDEAKGFHPYTTWSTTTFANANNILKDAQFAGAVERIGVLRSYATRHGAGPLPTQDATVRLDRHNQNNDWQGSFRTGCLDLVLLRYARRVIGPMDSLSLSHVDHIQSREYVCFGYLRSEAFLEPQTTLEKQEEVTRLLEAATPVLTGVPSGDVPALIEHYLQTPIRLFSHGPTHLDRSLSFRPASSTV